MTVQTVLGIGALVVLVGFIWFAFRQGMKVRRRPDGAPPEQTDGGSFT